MRAFIVSLSSLLLASSALAGGNLHCKSVADAAYFMSVEIEAQVVSPTELKSVTSWANRNDGTKDYKEIWLKQVATLKAGATGEFDFYSGWGYATMKLPEGAESKFTTEMGYGEYDGDYHYDTTFQMNCTLN